MLARVLQLLILCITIVVFGWFWFFWSRHPQLLVAASFFAFFLYIPFLGLQFIAVRHFNVDDPAPAASWDQLMRAWWSEVILMPPIFLWRLPFVSNQIPDDTNNPLDHRGKRGVVFIHGFICNRGIWTPWLAHAKNRQCAFVAVNLEPLFGSIEDYAVLIDQAVLKVTQDSGMPPLIVCHSMGGLAVRAWLRHADADRRVHHIVTIGSPHRGTWLGRFSFMTNGRQMSLSNDWLKQLEADEPAERHKLFTCYYSNCDNIVFPASTATLSGADNRLITGAAHIALAFNQTVMSESLDRI